MLGYGGTDKPRAAEEYSTRRLCADLAALLDVVGVQKAVCKVLPILPPSSHDVDLLYRLSSGMIGARTLRHGSRCGTQTDYWRWVCESRLSFPNLSDGVQRCIFQALYPIHPPTQGVHSARRSRWEGAQLCVPAVLCQPRVDEGNRGQCAVEPVYPQSANPQTIARTIPADVIWDRGASEKYRT
jgi:hypothetical protein